MTLPHTQSAEELLRLCASKVAMHRERPIFPQYADDGAWRVTDASAARPGFMPEEGAWTAGFWPGMLWIAAGTLADKSLDAKARQLAGLLSRRVDDTRTHDLGFVFTPAFVLGSRVSADPGLTEPAIAAARTLSQRFVANGGYMRAWGEPNSDNHAGITTIDALMNAAFVLWMARTTHDEHVRQLALRHAEQALAHQVRQDGSTAQVARYDPESGDFLGPDTHQGLNAQSCWSRGQAWAIYGFALCHLLEPADRYRDAVLSTSRFFCDHLLPNGMAPWDFAADDISRQTVDSSAMAIAAAGMLCLATEIEAVAAELGALANQLVSTLVDHAFIEDLSEPGLLGHGVFSLKRNVGIDARLIFGDFYFMDALSRLSGQPFAEYMRPLA
jgi:unsaturated chondroitin disaccharide hydrolase